MKQQLLILSAMALCLSLAFINPSAPHVDVYKLNTSASTLKWTGKKLTGEHYGTINFLSGELKDNHGAISGTFEIDMKSIVCTDQTGDSKTKLENHLKSEDFFGIEKFPKAIFVITSLAPMSAASEDGATHVVSGSLTIRDKTNPVSFNTALTSGDGKLTFKGTVTIDRSKYDVKFRSKTFFPDVGDKVIYDDFTLDFNVTLAK